METFLANQFLGQQLEASRMQSGGRIIGEGVDGCVFAEPAWPCEGSTEYAHIPLSRDGRYVSKIVPMSDTEDIYLKAAADLLGPLASTFIAKLEGTCKPANSKSPPKLADKGAYVASTSALSAWTEKDQACESLEKTLKEGKAISQGTHKIYYIQRYPITVGEWIKFQKNTDYKYLIRQMMHATPSFLSGLQRFYQNPNNQLFHIDLHIGNLFVRTQLDKSLQLGVSDFGHCLLKNTSTGWNDLPKYLSDYIQRYEFYSGYSQVPFEARLLNYCYQKKLDTVDPMKLVDQWENDREVSLKKLSTNDLVIVQSYWYLKYLKDKPIFWQMIKELQSLSATLRSQAANPTLVLSKKQSFILDFILSRYMTFSPINTITEALAGLKAPIPFRKEIEQTVIDTLGYQQRTALAADTGIRPFIRFLIRLLCAPYMQDVPLEQSLKTVMEADLSSLFLH